MRDRLPPLFSLQVFEAAARQGNFSRAALELHLTQSAVSRQIQLLENWCEQTLFARLGPKVQLTRAGHDLLARLGAPLTALRAAFETGEAEMLHLTVNTLASTARAWLVPRLKGFHDAHPKITLQLQTDYALINPAPNLATLAIRHGPPFSRAAGNESLHSELLFPETLLAVTSPELAQQIGEDPTLWESSAMLRHTSLDWSIWFDGIAIARTDAACGAAFNDASVLLDAAAAGLGVALTRYSLAYPRLLDGTLLAAAPQRCVSPSSHYLVCRKDCMALPAVAAFVTWLRQEAKTWTSLPPLT